MSLILEVALTDSIIPKSLQIQESEVWIRMANQDKLLGSEPLRIPLASTHSDMTVWLAS